MECQLSRVEEGWRFAFEQAVELPSMHQIGAHEAGEGERTGDRLLRRLRHPQQQKGDQRDGDLRRSR